MGVWLRRPHHHQHHKHTGAITEELSSYVVVVRRRTPPHIYLHFHIYIYIFIFIYIFIHIYIYIKFPFMKPLVFICGTYGYTTRNQWLRFTLSASSNGLPDMTKRAFQRKNQGGIYEKPMVFCFPICNLFSETRGALPVLPTLSSAFTA